VPVRGDHTDLRDLLERHGGFAVEAILLDLGVSSMILSEGSRSATTVPWTCVWTRARRGRPP
jgi:hypothetical protein